MDQKSLVFFHMYSQTLQTHALVLQDFFHQLFLAVKVRRGHPEDSAVQQVSSRGMRFQYFYSLCTTLFFFFLKCLFNFWLTSLSCGMQNILSLLWHTGSQFPDQESNPALGVWSLSHWTTREVPVIAFIVVGIINIQLSGILTILIKHRCLCSLHCALALHNFLAALLYPETPLPFPTSQYHPGNQHSPFQFGFLRLT